MKQQPDLAQMPFEFETMTWRDHVRTAIELLAAIMGGVGIFAIAVSVQELMK